MSLVTTNLGKQYRRDFWGLKDFSLEVGPGILGLLGPNGAGKTAAIMLLLKPFAEHIHPYLWGKICITFCITKMPPKINAQGV